MHFYPAPIRRANHPSITAFAIHNATIQIAFMTDGTALQRSLKLLNLKLTLRMLN